MAVYRRAISKKYERAKPVTAIVAQASAATMYGDDSRKVKIQTSKASCLRSNFYLDAHRGGSLAG